MCIEYCRGIGINYYSVLGQSSCTCGTLQGSSPTSLVPANDWNMCSKTSSYSLFGNNSDTGGNNVTITIYNYNHANFIFLQFMAIGSSVIIC